MTDSLKTGVINAFKDEYAFLSNFHMGEFTWRGVPFASGEHAFQAAKMWHISDSYLSSMTDYLEKVQAAPTPAKAKYEGRSVKIDVPEWNERRVWYMREIVHAKFSEVKGLAGQLLSTGATLLVEGNDWGDDFWGRCKKDGKWVGLNTLGTILMEERGYWLHSDFGDKK